jgi:tetratricopeptide (TPR) repeat protein
MIIFLTVGSIILLYSIVTIILYGSFYCFKSPFPTVASGDLNEESLNLIYSDAYFQRGNLFHQKGIFDRALHYYNEAITLNSSHPLAEKHHNYAMLKKLVPSLSFENGNSNEDNEQDTFSPLNTFLSKKDPSDDDYDLITPAQNGATAEVEMANIAGETKQPVETAASDPTDISITFVSDTDNSAEPVSLQPQTDLDITVGPAESTSIINLTIAADSDSDTDSFQLGQTLLKQGILPEAIVEFDKSIAANPSFPDAYLARASALLKSKRIEDAVLDFDKIIELEPTNLKALNKRGNIFLHQGKFDAAIEDYTAALAMKPDYLKCLMRRGICYFRLQKLDDAIADFTSALSLDPTNREALANRGMAHYKTGREDLGQKDLEQAETLQDGAAELKDSKQSIPQANPLPQVLQQFFEQGIIELNNNNETSALIAFDRVLKDEPKHSDSYFQRANIHFNNKRFDQAIEDYNKAIEHNLSFAAAYCKRGQANIQANLYIAAINDFDKAIDLLPGDAEAYFNRAKANSQRAQRDAAISDFSKVIEIAPDNDLAYYSRGIEWQNLGKYDKALADLDKACNLGHNAACIAYINIQNEQE